MSPAPRLLVFQTAFPGDVILTLPILQALRERYPEGHLVLVTIPAAAGVAENHPAVNAVVEYDKKGRDRGVAGMIRMVRRIRSMKLDVAVVPHRSLRSAFVVRAARIPRRIGFSTSAGRALFTDVMRYGTGVHETVRNLSLLRPLGISRTEPVLPRVFPSAGDVAAVDELIAVHRRRVPSFAEGPLVALAPGSVWMTKRWPEGSYAAVSRTLAAEGIGVVLVGGADDAELCRRVADSGPARDALHAAGRLSMLQSAELIRRCRVLVCNDSAPMHLAGAVGTPVIALFGATVPAFGFAPLGPRDRVLEIQGLPCRPCAIHGGPRCPLGTLECLQRITAVDVLHVVREYLV